MLIGEELLHTTSVLLNKNIIEKNFISVRLTLIGFF